MKKYFIANWKMQLLDKDSGELVSSLAEKLKFDTESVEVVIAPSLLSVPGAVQATQDSDIKISVQNISERDLGAFTGETGIEQLFGFNIKYAIVGHSERRQYFGETDDLVNKKTKKLLKSNITPIVCIGETLAEEEGGETKEVLSSQIELAFEGVDLKQDKIILAYEPVWAIGTGKIPGREDLENVLQIIEGTLSSVCEDFSREDIGLLYGGSVKPENILEFVNDELFDGVLVGGASLDEDKFIDMVKTIEK
jgi:triosephosphate isomerase (TIM)